jgi:hypothetical protein
MGEGEVGFQWALLAEGWPGRDGSIDLWEKSKDATGYRPTLNSYMYGDAIAIAKVARLLDQPRLAN